MKYNVLSLCDGISVGRLALERAGVKVGYYAASEIDKFAIKITKHNYPANIQIGDVNNVKVSRIPFDIDLLLMGFPCQGFSFSGLQLNFDDPRSQLFFRGVKILAECRKYNPQIKFLFENVKMDKRSEAVISTMLHVKPIRICSSLVSGQTRKRLYWTNIEGIEQPEDRGIMLRDVLEDEVDAKYNISQVALERIQRSISLEDLIAKLTPDKSKCITCSIGDTTDKEYFGKKRGQLVLGGAIRGRLNADSKYDQTFEVNYSGKSNALTGVEKDNMVMQLNPAKEFGNQPRMQNRKYDSAFKSPALTVSKADQINVVIINKDGKIKPNQNKAGCLTGGAHSGGNHSDMDLLIYPDDLLIRRLSPKECSRLQTLPDTYFWDAFGNQVVSDSQIYKSVGNAWNADTVAHIFSYL